MTGSVKRVDLRVGAFACSVQGFDDPVPALLRVLQELRETLSDMPAAGDTAVLFDDATMRRLEAALADDAGDALVSAVPGLVVTRADTLAEPAPQPDGDENSTAMPAAGASAETPDDPPPTEAPGSEAAPDESGPAALSPVGGGDVAGALEDAATVERAEPVANDTPAPLSNGPDGGEWPSPGAPAADGPGPAERSAEAVAAGSNEEAAVNIFDLPDDDPSEGPNDDAGSPNLFAEDAPPDAAEAARAEDVSDGIAPGEAPDGAPGTAPGDDSAERPAEAAPASRAGGPGEDPGDAPEPSESDLHGIFVGSDQQAAGNGLEHGAGWQDDADASDAAADTGGGNLFDDPGELDDGIEANLFADEDADLDGSTGEPSNVTRLSFGDLGGKNGGATEGENEAPLGAAPLDISVEELARVAGASAVPDLIGASAAWLSIVRGHASFTRREVLEVFDRLPGDHARTAEAKLKGFGKLVRNGQLSSAENDRFSLSGTERDRYEDLLP